MKAMVKSKVDLMTFTPEEHQLIRNQIFPRSLSDSHFKVFWAFCQAKRLNPILNQVRAVPRKNNRSGEVEMTIQTSIDGYRATAARTGEYAGSDDAVFDNELQPRKATVTVWRFVQGVRCPFTASARWDQYYPGDHQGFQWKKMPHVMLGKCAEALALRKGFPEELGGIYTDDEMEQAKSAIVHPTEIIEAPKPEVTYPVNPTTGAPEEVISQANPPEAELPLPTPEQTMAEVVQDKRVKIMAALVGKGKPFGSKVGDAKAWVAMRTGGQDIMALDLDGCLVVEDAIQRGDFGR